MPVTGKFLSDFSDFDRGAKNAQVTLDNFQKAADKAGGRLMDLGGYSDKSGGKILQFTNQFREFDSLMSAAGVNIGPIGRAISEIGTAASSSATSLGLLGTAGVAVGGALASYNLARWALEFTGAAQGLDTWIQKLTQSMFGFKDGAAEAGAKADVLARASANAKRPITDYAEAIEINRKAAAALALQMGQTANAHRDTNILISDWQRELREVRKEGNIEALNDDLKLNMQTMEQLAGKYGLTTQALQYYKNKLAETAAEEDKAAQVSAAANAKRVADAEAAAKAAEAFRADRWKQQLQLETDIVASTQRQSAAYLALTNNAVLKEFEAQRQLTGAVEVQEDAYTRLAAKTYELTAAKVAGFSTTAQESLAMQQFGQELMDTAIAEEKLRFGLQQAPAVAAPAINAWKALGLASKEAAGYFEELKGKIDNAVQTANTLAAAANKPVVGGSVAGMAPNWSQALVPKYGAGGYLGTGAPGITVNINGSVLSNKDEIARVVGDAVTSSYRTGGNRLPV